MRPMSLPSTKWARNSASRTASEQSLSLAWIASSWALRVQGMSRGVDISTSRASANLLMSS